MSQQGESSNIRLKKTNTGKGTPPVSQPPLPPTPGAGMRSPIFDIVPGVYAEAKRQLKLIDKELNTETRDGKQQNLLHVLRGILDADRRGVVIRAKDRAEFISADEATNPQVEQLLAELEQAGYLDVTTRRQKNHDYRASQKAYDTWNKVQLYEGIPSMRTHSYGSQGRVDHYLVPFDAKTYLCRVPSRDPRDLPLDFEGFHLIPCKEGTIAANVIYDYSRHDYALVFLDLQDHELNARDCETSYHERLYRYLGIPALGSQIDEILREVPHSTDTLVPRYEVKNAPESNVDASIIFQGKSGGHYQVPEDFLVYLYNNYFGEDLDIQVSSKPVSTGGYPGSGYLGSTYDRFLIVVRRCGSKHPLLLYRFGQIRERLATIT